MVITEKPNFEPILVIGNYLHSPLAIRRSLRVRA